MHRVLIIMAAALVWLSSPAPAADKGLTVVELYTSQGCSSCPPADRLVGVLSKRDDVLALSMHVDYWDYIGWKDRFARPEHTDRQRAYSQRFKLRYVYTPQMVIDGVLQGSGGNAGDIENMIRQAQETPRVALQLVREDGALNVALPDGAVSEAVEVISIFADRRHDTPIKKGENGGRTLSYHNVVRDMQVIGTWRGKAGRIAVPMSETGGDICAVILQEPKSRRILGAVQIALDGS